MISSFRFNFLIGQPRRVGKEAIREWSKVLCGTLFPGELVNKIIRLSLGLREREREREREYFSE